MNAYAVTIWYRHKNTATKREVVILAETEEGVKERFDMVADRKGWTDARIIDCYYGGEVLD